MLSSVTILPIETYLPIFLIVINVLTAIVYAIKGNWWMTCYWLAAAILTFIVTFRPR